jgi:hypothetical protein
MTYILLGALACALTSLVTGLAVIRASKIALSRLECICTAYVIGSALVSTFTLAAALTSLARRGVFLSIAAVALVGLWHFVPWLKSLKPASLDGVSFVGRCLFAAALLVYGGIYLRHALTPEMSPDGQMYHLGLVNLWNHAHRMSRITDVYAALPQGMEMLFLFAFSIGRHSAAALTHFSFLVLLPIVLLLYGIRFGGAGAAGVAGIIAFVTPLVGWDGSVAYNDVALAVSVTTSVYLLQIWRHERAAGALLAGSLLAGYCFSIKYTGAFVPLLFIGTVLWDLRRERPAIAARTLLIAVCVIAIAPVPYLARNWFWFHNPIAFFGNSIFPNPYFHISFERSYTQDMAHLNGISWSELPREITFGGPKLPDSLGPLYALAPIALVGVLFSQTRFLLLGALIAAGPFVANKSARFLIPALPLILLVMCFVLNRLSRSALVLYSVAGIQLVLSWPAVVNWIHSPRLPGPELASSSWQVALRREPEERYLAGSEDEYVMARQIESHVPEGEIVFALRGGAAQSYTTRFILSSYRSAVAEKAFGLLYAQESSPADYRWRWSAAFPRTLTREILIYQTAVADEMWNVSEVRLLDRGRLVPEPQHLRWFARPNPWDANLLSDGVEVTRWRSWERMRPGMYVGVEMKPPQFVDGIEILSGNGPWAASLDPRMIDTSGRWLCPVSAGWHAAPPLDLRKAAAAELKREGIRYVLISQYAPDEQEFRKKPGLWSMRELVSTREATLYQIE